MYKTYKPCEPEPFWYLQSCRVWIKYLIFSNSCGQCCRVSHYYLDFLFLQYVVSLLEPLLQRSCRRACFTFKALHLEKRSESTRLDVESSSWEMPLLLQLIMTSPGALTHPSEFGSRTVGEGALNSAERCFLYQRGQIWTPVGRTYFGEIDCKIVTLSFQVERSREV